MKKIFTLIAAALVAMTVSAQKTLEAEAAFNLTTVGDGTVVGGSFAKSGVNNSDDTELGRWTMKSSGAYIECTVETALKVGDAIMITGVPKSASTAGFVLRAEGTTTATDLATLTLSKGAQNKEVTVSYTVEEGNGLVGLTKFYVMPKDKDRQWWMESIVIPAIDPAVVAADKAWDYTGFAETAKTTANIVCDQMLYGVGVSIAKVSYAGGDNPAWDYIMLNLPGNSGTKDDDSFTAANGKYLMFYVNGKGSIKLSIFPNGSSKKNLYCQVGSAEPQKDSQNGTATIKTAIFTFDVAEQTPVYLYVGGNAGTYYIKDITVTYDGATGIAEAKAKKSVADNVYYNLAGQKVQPKKGGLYIYNGKKVVF